MTTVEYWICTNQIKYYLHTFVMYQQQLIDSKIPVEQNGTVAEICRLTVKLHWIHRSRMSRIGNTLLLLFNGIPMVLVPACRKVPRVELVYYTSNDIGVAVNLERTEWVHISPSKLPTARQQEKVEIFYCQKFHKSL